MDTAQLAQDYARTGFISGIKLFSTGEATNHREELERAEALLGPLHYQSKIHTVLRSPYDLATHPRLIDIVEQILGPDILLYNVVYIVKEPNTPNFVSWHQDLTYWGFNSDDQVSAWIALSPATGESGCMQMIPGSHERGMKTQVLTDNPNNVLYLGQTIEDICEDDSILCPLNPGEVSLHHGWTVHSSTANNTNDRRIGLNIQYIKPSMYQQNSQTDSAMLVRGNDSYGHFQSDPIPPQEIPPNAKERLAKHSKNIGKISTKAARL